MCETFATVTSSFTLLDGVVLSMTLCPSPELSRHRTEVPCCFRRDACAGLTCSGHRDFPLSYLSPVLSFGFVLGKM